MESHQAKFTFPVTASVALKNAELTREILRCGHEVAVHGFKHVNYSYITEQQQNDDIKKALDAYKALDIQVYGFRAPYNVYTEETPKLIEKYGFLWDIGIGYNAKYQQGNSPFRVTIEDHKSSFVSIPLNKLSDDFMIDIQGFSSRQMNDTIFLSVSLPATKLCTRRTRNAPRMLSRKTASTFQIGVPYHVFLRLSGIACTSAPGINGPVFCSSSTCQLSIPSGERSGVDLIPLKNRGATRIARSLNRNSPSRDPSAILAM